MSPEEQKTFQDIRITDIVIFATVLSLWLVNLLMMCFRRRLHNRLVTAILYGIIGIIVFTRLIEVITIRMYESQIYLFIAGVFATYAKIALGCCQLSAMFEIRAQMKMHILK